jgi:hypothetical protein
LQAVADVVLFVVCGNNNADVHVCMVLSFYHDNILCDCRV